MRDDGDAIGFHQFVAANIFHIPIPLAEMHGLAMRERQSAIGIAVLAGLVAFSVAACGSEQPSMTTPSLTFDGPSAQTVTSASGQLTIDVRWSPSVPVRGSDAAQLTFLDAGGNPMDGLDLSIVPWMPAHGHGTAVQPVTTTTAPGVQVATPLYLFMSGEWQLRMTITGAMDDAAIATVEIP